MAHVGKQTGRLPEALRTAASSRPVATAPLDGHRQPVRLPARHSCWPSRAICGFLLYFIVPKFEAIFKDFGDLTAAR